MSKHPEGKTKYTHVLELKEGTNGQPNQYRITVLEDTVGKLLEYRLGTSEDEFKTLGYYETHEELVAVLEPHLAFEASK